MTNARIWRGGVTTEPEIKLLLDKVTLAPGDEIAHETIEEIISQPRTSNRYKTITMRWRNRMFRERGLEIAAIDGGLRALLPGERVRLYSLRVGLHLRGIRRYCVRNETVNTADLTPAELAAKDGTTQRALAISAADRAVCRSMAPPHPTRALPRVAG